MDTLKYVFGNYKDCDAICDYFKGQGVANAEDFGFDNPDNAYYITEKGNVDFMRKDSPMFRILSRYGRMEEFKVMPDNSAEKVESCDGRPVRYGFRGNPVTGPDLIKKLKEMGGVNTYLFDGIIKDSVYYFEKPGCSIYACYEKDIDDDFEIKFIDE